MGFQEGSCLIGFGVLSLEQDLVRGFGENLVWGLENLVWGKANYRLAL